MKFIIKMNVLDLFCGCGGFTKGFADAGLNVVAGIDTWDKAISNYSKNHNHTALCRDLTSYPPEEFVKETGISSVDIIIGGPPCQGFSIAGKRNVDDPRNSLFKEFVKYIRYFNPAAFCMENVVGILSIQTVTGEKVIDIIIEELSYNYNVTVNKVSAQYFDVPQNRRRVIIIGYRKDIGVPTLLQCQSEIIPVKDVLEPRETIAKKYYLSEKAIAGIIKKKEKSIEAGNGFGAQFLDLNKPCFTIPARYYKDGYDALVKYSDNEIRRLTVTELKRIQTFGDAYILEGNNKDVVMQIGNAIPCKLAYHIAMHIRREIEDKVNIIKLFEQHIKGRTFSCKYNHCGSEGYWLEEQFGLAHNNKNSPDIYGFELKKQSSKITFGDFSASEYLFSKETPYIEAYITKNILK